MKQFLKSIAGIFTLFVLSNNIVSAQTPVVGKWKIVKYDMAAQAKGENIKEAKEVSGEYIYEFKEDKTFKGKGWLNPFRGGLNSNELEGTYALTGNEVKITCKKDQDENKSYFYYQVSTENDFLVLSFDKNGLIKWFKDSKDPEDSFAKQISQTMFSTLDCKLYLQKIQ